MDKILLVCAMEEELKAFSIVLKKSQIKYTYKNNIYKFKINKKEVYATKIGITFFNISRLIKLINKIQPTELISFGTEAGLIKQKIGDVIVSNNIVCADLNLTNFGYLDGTIDKKKNKIYGPLMCSGSHFLSSKEEKYKLKIRFKGVATFDMESYMIYRIAKDYNIPFMAMKAISDNGEEKPSYSFEKNLNKATIASSKYILKFLKTKSIKSLLK